MWRVLASLDVKPRKMVGWLNRRDDPEFWDRDPDVCGPHLSKLDNVVVVSVDEKTGIHAKERLTPTTPQGREGREGRAARSS